MKQMAAMIKNKNNSIAKNFLVIFCCCFLVASWFSSRLFFSFTPALAADTVTAAQYEDTNKDGKVDKITWFLDDIITSCVYEAGDWKIENSGTIGLLSINNVTCQINSSTLVMYVRDINFITGGETDPIISYRNQGTQNSIGLASGPMSAKLIVAQDKAAPIILERSYEDAGNDGSVDRLVVKFSEKVNLLNNAKANFIIEDNSLTGYSFNSVPIALISGNGTDTFIFSTSGTHNLTGALGGIEPGLWYYQYPNMPDDKVQDLKGNNLLNDGNFMPLTDNAPPVINADKPINYKDNDNNGQIDQVEITFTEYIKYPNFEATDWQVNANGLTDFQITGCLAETFENPCAEYSENIVLTATAKPNLTGASNGVQPTISYQQSGVSNIVEPQGLNSDALPFSNLSINDNANPLLVSTLPADKATEIAQNANIIVTFSEPMNINSVVKAASPNPGNWQVTWRNNDTEAVYSHNNFNISAPYTLAVIQAPDKAGNPLSQVDIVPNPWTFTTSSQAIPLPSCTLLINNNTASTTNLAVNLNLTTNMTVIQMMVSNDSQFTNISWETFSATQIWTLTGAADSYGAKTVYVKVKDSSGQISNVCSDTIEYIQPPTLPTCNLLIDNNTTSTTSLSVNLNSTTNVTVSQMMVSNDSQFTNDSWETYAATKSWTLTGAADSYGTKTVYLKVKDATGNVSSVCQDSIDYVQTPPDPACTPLINSGTAKTNSLNVSLNFTVNTSVSQMLVSNDSQFSGANWENYVYTKQWVLSGAADSYGTKTVYVKVKNAIKESAVCSDTIEYVKEEITGPTLITHDPEPAGPLPVGVQIGTLVKRPDMSVVYFIDQDNRRHAFPNSTVFSSYFKDFSTVKTISAETLAAIPLGSNVVMRPGTYLIKIQSDPNVYAVEPYGVIRWLQSEQIASALYGPDWSSKIVDVDPTFFINYQVGLPVATMVHPTGSAFSYQDSAAVYYIDNNTKRYIATPVFLNNIFQNKFIIRNISPAITYPSGTDWPLQNMETIMSLR